jgi:hypothetical protein
MARGWESKSVEEQIAAAEAERQAREHAALTAGERERRAQREKLLLSRAKILGDLEAAHNDRHRALLKRALADLDAALGEPHTPA